MNSRAATRKQSILNLLEFIKKVLMDDFTKLEIQLAWIGHQADELQKRLAQTQMKLDLLICIHERKVHEKLIKRLKEMNKKLFM